MRVTTADRIRSLPMHNRENVKHLDDYPRSMRDPNVRDRRRAMLKEPHMKPLTAYVGGLRKRELGDVPNFDPLDGGINARVLFLFEKPGPMTAATGKKERDGSGFISRNNDDPTAEATLRFMNEAGIPRKLTITWNLIPWWNGTRKITTRELHDGKESLKNLIGLLPNLRAVVMVGQKAKQARTFLETGGKTLFNSAHPSPLVRAKSPATWSAIPSEWAKVLRSL